MFCGICNRELEDCVCANLTERMRKASGPNGPLASKWCAGCDNHYTGCKCAEPDWKIRTNGELHPVEKFTTLEGKPCAF
jgi:hypothetical protein